MKFYEWIGPVGANEPISAAMVKQNLASAGGGPITVTLHSEGGEVHEGFAIYNLIKNYKGRSVCEVSSAFSIASYIAMAFSEIEIASNGFYMLHPPSLSAGGTAAQLRADADHLDQLDANLRSAYLNRTAMTPSELNQLMESEAFIGADDAVRLGLADRIAGHSRLAEATASRSRGRLAVARVTRTISAAKRWERAVANCRSRCRSAAEAVRLANKENPGLRQRLIDEANSR